VTELSSISSGVGRSVSDLAIAWLVAQDGFTGAIVGVRTEEEARQLADAARWTPSEEVLRTVEACLGRFERGAPDG
jgi:aryl-alcohol dehydrogenase-like predicted oxidoreductase